METTSSEPVTYLVEHEELPKPVLVEQLKAVGVSEGAASSAENVRVATSTGEFLRSETADILKSIEEDVTAKSKIEESLVGKQAELAKVDGEISTLRADILTGEIYVKEAIKLIEGDDDLLVSIAKEREELSGELEGKRNSIRIEMEAALQEAAKQGMANRAEYKAIVEARPEIALIGWKEDLKAVAKLEAVVNDPDFSTALDRLKTSMGGIGVAAGVESMRLSAEEAANKRDELAEAVRKDRQEMDREAAIRREEIEKKAKTDEEAAEAEYKQKAQVLDQKEERSKKRREEHQSIAKENSEKVAMFEVELGSKLDTSTGLAEKIREEERKIYSLDKDVTVARELLALLAKGVVENVKELSTRGREVMDTTRMAVVSLSNSYEEKVIFEKDKVLRNSLGKISLLDETTKKEMEDMGKAESEAKQRATEGLVGTGLYEVGADGELVAKLARGLDSIVAERRRRPEVDAVLDSFEGVLGMVEGARVEARRRYGEKVLEVIEERSEIMNELNTISDLERSKYDAALAAMEVVASTLPPQAEAGGSAEAADQSVYGTAIKAIGGMLSKLFGKRG